MFRLNKIAYLTSIACGKVSWEIAKIGMKSCRKRNNNDTVETKVID